MSKPQYKAYANGTEISIPANGDKDCWIVIANGQRVATITEWADGFTVEGEVTAEIRSFIGELQAANRAARDAATVKESLTVHSIPAPKPASVPMNLLGLRIVKPRTATERFWREVRNAPANEIKRARYRVLYPETPRRILAPTVPVPERFRAAVSK